MRTCILVYIIKEVALVHSQNAPLEQFLTIAGLGVLSRQLSEICWLRMPTFVITLIVLPSFPVPMSIPSLV